MRQILILLFMAAFGAPAHAQALDPSDYIYPVEGVAGLYSANFGEMRPGHFHAGIDIKTDGVEGKPLVAVADGYVSRLSIAPGGYGRAIYLTLRNGTTAVYGHLQRFRDDIEEYLRAERRRQRRNSLDLSFGPEQWPVKQGDRIGYSGNSGSSSGPHLHFEIRDTPTQRVRNVVREGIVRPTDDIPPRILRVHYVEVDTLQGIPVHGPEASYSVVRDADGRYRLTREEPVPTGPRGYFIAEVTDRRNGVGNTFGVWRVTASMDGEPYFEYRMDGFTFDLSRCCDAVSCYPMQRRSRNEVIRLAQLEGAPNLFYTVMRERGLVRVAEGSTHRIRIEVEDDCGNRSQLEFSIRGTAPTLHPAEVVDSLDIPLYADRMSVLRYGTEAVARIPAGALHESFFVRPERTQVAEKLHGVVFFSPAYRFLGPDTPLRQAAVVSIEAQVPREYHLRATLAARTSSGGWVPAGGTYSNGAVNAVTRSTGDLAVVADTLPPTIRPLFTEGADLSKAASIRLRVGDNFSGIAAWTMTIDGEWVPSERYPMRGTLVHEFDTPPQRRRHTIRLSVRDAAGNIARYEGSFVR